MIVVTGAAGFIGANIVEALNKRGRSDVVAVDFFKPDCPNGLSNLPKYLDSMEVQERVDARDLLDWLGQNGDNVDGIIHMGACSDTTQTDREFIMSVNLEYTRSLWNWCTENNQPFVYASSAATYGDGEQGYDDQQDPSVYKPLNLYGESKQLFDLWALEQTQTPPRWGGVKFFNVYGPREYHKGRMASVAFHAYNQILQNGQVKLFESHKEGYAHGGQKRDFVFVGDVVDIVLYLLETPASQQCPNGLYNAGTGTARTFEDLARAVFTALDKEPNIVFIPMPEDLRGKYQYFTQATCDKITKAGFDARRTSLEEGVRKYVEFLNANTGVYA